MLAFAQTGQRRRPGGYIVLTDYPRAAQLLFLTGLRSQEIGDLHWSEVNLNKGEIFFVTERTKNGIEPLCVPLSDMAIEILRKTKAEAARPGDPCVFGRGDGKTVLLGDLEWKKGLYLGDLGNKIKNRIKRGGIGFWKHEIDPAMKKNASSMPSRLAYLSMKFYVKRR
jgi:integrase